MRKLTKIINRRRKNYKPTIAVIDTRTNKVMSVNATVFYINQEKQRKYEEWKKERDNSSWAFLKKKCLISSRCLMYLAT